LIFDILQKKVAPKSIPAGSLIACKKGNIREKKAVRRGEGEGEGKEGGRNLEQ